MDPLLKWPGGKKREARYVRRFLPEHFDRYIEPFFGGGGVCFTLLGDYPDVPVVANDIDGDLIRFYRLVQSNSPELRRHLSAQAEEWRRLETVAAILLPVAEPLLDFCFTRGKTEPEPAGLDRLTTAVRDALAAQRAVFRPEISFASFTAVAAHCVTGKVRRLADMETRRRGARLTPAERCGHLEAGVKSGYYSYFRGIRLRGRYVRHVPADAAETAAIFFFLREFCYGSMFRYNAAGQFNIPYGGMSYNRKDFAAKAERLFQPETQSFLRRVEFRRDDFRVIMKSVAPGDFVFLDPPYDSEFSAYGQNEFGLDDHADLAGCFSRMPGRGVLIIKDTPRIRAIYREYADRRELFWLNYDKQYAYNMRGRNNRAASHLLITNFSPGFA